MLLACSTNTNTISLDNPSLNDINIKINDSIYFVYALESKKIELKTGDYTFKVYDAMDSLICDKKIFIVTDGLLNLFKTTYVKYTDAYITGNTAQKVESQSIELNGHIYTDVNFDVYTDFFIPKTWDYDVFEPWKKSIPLYFRKRTLKSKIYRLDNLEEDMGFKLKESIYDLSIAKIDSVINETELKLKKIED